MRCDIGLVQIGAHKLVLSSASPVFQDLLKNNPHPSPLIYMRGIKTEVLQAIVDFVYCGQASVDRKDLTAFLALAFGTCWHGIFRSNFYPKKCVGLRYIIKRSKHAQLEI